MASPEEIVAAERLRAAAETARQQQEGVRQAQEVSRATAEEARGAAEDGRAAAFKEVSDTVADLTVLLERMEIVESMRRSGRTPGTE